MINCQTLPVRSVISCFIGTIIVSLRSMLNILLKLLVSYWSQDKKSLYIGWIRHS